VNRQSHVRVRDLYPSGTQYLFDWTFSMPTNGSVVWNGITGWAGGHTWYVTISNITLVALPQLSITQAGNGSVRVAWATNFNNCVLEFAAALPAAGWSAATNAVTAAGDDFSTTVDADGSHRFYRLRQP